MTVLKPASLAGRYQLGDLIGRGGMADVHIARDELLHRDVAVKLLRNPADPTHRARFASEVSTLAGLHHPHVVTLLDAGLDGEVPFLVMDLVAGRTLAGLAADGPVGREQARRIGAQVAGALAHAHAAGFVHRDVKPGNILLDHDGQAYLTDFGIARLLGSVDGHTRADELVGSPAFLAPEQVEGGLVTAAADVYSLGLVLLEVLTGQRAYTGTPVEAAIARLRVAPLIPTSLGAELCRLLERMTRLDPAARPTAAEVADALSGATVLGVVPGAVTDPDSTGSFAPVVVEDLPGEGTTVLGTSNPPPSTRRRWFAALGAAAALVAGVLVAPSLASTPTEPSAPVPVAKSKPAPAVAKPSKAAARTVARPVALTSTRTSTQASTRTSTRTSTQAKAPTRTHVAAKKGAPNGSVKTRSVHHPAHHGHH